jgi:hypothetical protein
VTQITRLSIFIIANVLNAFTTAIQSIIGQQGQQVTQVNFDEFFNQVIINQRSSGAEAGMIRRYESLRQVFKNQFTNLTVYRVGEIQVQVYITGVNCLVAWLA